MILEKEDVTLYYQIAGQVSSDDDNPWLLLIHGVVVDAWLYEAASAYLSRFYQVITFDRRGSSRSTASADAKYDMDAQISDVKDLLDALHIEKTLICGCSAGALVGEYFMEKYPERVSHLIMYEPPILSLLTWTDQYKDWVAKMKDLISRRKLNSAMLEFVKSIGELDSRAPAKPEEVSFREMGNMHPFLEHEYSVFMDYLPDLELLGTMTDKLTIAVGEKSGDAPYPTAAKELAKKTGARLMYYPGLHNLPADLPFEFAACVLGTLMLRSA